eukprot:scaffold87843_cov60-Phaeocystis_antarctica.AAC.5
MGRHQEEERGNLFSPPPATPAAHAALLASRAAPGAHATPLVVLAASLAAVGVPPLRGQLLDRPEAEAARPKRRQRRERGFCSFLGGFLIPPFGCGFEARLAVEARLAFPVVNRGALAFLPRGPAAGRLDPAESWLRPPPHGSLAQAAAAAASAREQRTLPEVSRRSLQRHAPRWLRRRGGLRAGSAGSLACGLAGLPIERSLLRPLGRVLRLTAEDTHSYEAPRLRPPSGSSSSSPFDGGGRRALPRCDVRRCCYRPLAADNLVLHRPCAPRAYKY